MNLMIERGLLCVGVLGLVMIARMVVSIAATAWYEGRHQLVEDIKDWSCERFHEIMNRPRPWYVKVDDVLTRRLL